MNKYILGSGLTALLIKEIVGDDWQIIPFARSRFFSVRPPLSDDYLYVDKSIDELLGRSLNLSTPILRRKAFSIAGELIYHAMPIAVAGYVKKLFGINPHPAAHKLLERTEGFVYSARLLDIYIKLERKFAESIKSSPIHGRDIVSIGDKEIKLGDKSVEFDKLIVTIPLPALYKLCGKKCDLPSATLYVYHITTPYLDFESADELLIADDIIDFHHAVSIGPNQYIIYSTRDLGNANAYLAQFTNNKVNIAGMTEILDGVPRGAPPDLSELENNDIYQIGRYAQWDWFMDASSSIKRLSRIINKL